MDRYTTHEHDVLVIGAGGAGLRAASEASAEGARVGLPAPHVIWISARYTPAGLSPSTNPGSRRYSCCE